MKFVIAASFALFAPAMAMAHNADDAALMKSCPGLSAWATTHPRSDGEPRSNAGTEVVPSEDALQRELARRAQLDQHARAPLMSGKPPASEELKNLAAVDADNIAWLRALVADDRYPTLEAAGKRGVSDAWLLVQHADSDPDIQRNVLGILMADPDAFGVPKQELALLFDRVRVADGKPQRYGTQFVRDAKGELVLEGSLEEPAGVDARRADMDQMPIDVYKCVLHSTYDASTATDDGG